MREEDRITAIKGIGEKAAEELQKMGIQSVGDLIQRYPSRYERYEEPVSVAEAKDGSVCAIRGMLTRSLENKRTPRMMLMA